MTKTTNILKQFYYAGLLPRGSSYSISRRVIKTSFIKRHLHSTSPCLTGSAPLKLTQEDVRYNGVRVTLHPEEDWSNDVFEKEITSITFFNLNSFKYICKVYFL